MRLRRLVLGVGLALLLPHGAAADRRAPIEVDWSDVGDDTIARCGLRGLENLLVQYLVEGGYAVVQEVGTDGIRVRIRAVEDRFEVAVSRGERVSRETVPMPEPCDASIQLDLIRAVLALAEPLRAAWARDERERERARARAVEPPAPPRERHLAIGAGVLFPGALHPFGLVRGAYRLHLGSVRVGPLVEIGGTKVAGLFLLEPAIGASVEIAWLDLGGVSLVGGGELAALAHLVLGGPSLAGHVDGRVGLAIGVVTRDEAFAFLVTPCVRLTRVVHEVEGQEELRIERIGISARVELRL